ncbi:MAG: hypothetical protein E6K80_02650 [Candidatus Eisenbacteria bacterium]|uniref:Uncharacterized protein n=1 Tax=Eiseniibacteriota bacterium TaxID=2212470 RepID=A0A538U9C4_UNCEI|nr:MAG: hypothetical protein E6K80_02650 [Candidatus Eisenbacteria bacterium]
MREVLPSWLFRALLWPFWSIGGVTGLFVWRWATTLLAFGLAWLIARRMGARGLLPLLVLALCALIYRQRSMVRPETMVVVLLATELWILETRRQGGPDRAPWVIAIACVWANAHLSYYLGLVVLAIFWLDERLTGESRGARLGLGRVLLASIGVSFLNPFGWRALWQPFEYFLFWRHEPIFQIVSELQPVTWSANAENGLPLLIAGWPLLLLWRAGRRRLDRVEIALAAWFTALVCFGQRFLGFYAVIAAAYVARDLAELAGAMRWPARWPLWARAAAVSVACLTLGIPEWSSPDLPLGVRLRPLWYPERACDFMMEHGVRGRGFNPFDLAGYQLYRFWPERDRLPFMDIHQTGTRADRDAYAYLYSYPRAWSVLDGRHHFDYALLARHQIKGNAGLDALDADSSFALVFVDDVAALFVRRQGPLAAVAETFRYRLLPAGSARVAALQTLCTSDSAACNRLVAELERATRESPRNSQTRSLLASVALLRGDLAQARDQLTLALAANPLTPRAHDRLGIIRLRQGNPRAALIEFRAERRLNGPLPGLDFRMGQAYRRLGDRDAAARAFRRELERDAGNREAADSLAAVERG